MATTATESDQVITEHERRFVPDMGALPFDFKNYPKKSILQGYLGDKPRTRLRDESNGQGHSYFQTRKTGSGISRIEDEKRITVDEFVAKWKKVEYRLVKTRYFIKWDNVDVKLNVFHGKLEGYVQIEVEFASHEDAINFTPPSWLGREVTDDKRHGNYRLAKDGIPS